MFTAQTAAAAMAGSLGQVNLPLAGTGIGYESESSECALSFGRLGPVN